MKIALISPRGPLYRHRTGIFKKSLRYAPLTLTTLAALVPEELGAELLLFDEGIEEVDLDMDVDLVAISAITGTAPRSYELAAHYRRRGIPVVLGGVHATLVPEEAQLHADSVVTGYAEESWPRLLRDLRQGELKPRYHQSPTLSLAGLPRPRRDLLRLEHYFTPHTVEATRACVHQCQFCVVPTAWGNKPLQHPVEDVVADIEAMNARRVIFLDLNMIADVGYAKRLFQALIPLGIRWAGLATTMIAWDDELLRLAARSGCRGLLIGFETISREALQELRKGFNLHRDYHEVVQRIHDAGMAIMGTFIFGFDAHGPEAFEATAEFVMKANIDLPRFSILTPFPGTPLFKKLEAEGRLLTRDWGLYDGQHVVFRPARMSQEELQLGIERVWKEVYSLGNIARRLLGSRKMLLTSLAANLGYRFYAHNLSRFYTCGEAIAA
ncbi:MAG: B12-binding domain-containing radical SAM protein [Armatimonadetes bacterium]|nr:B12-binding domain-containing radical SAM protein [Armatimonadota bacterium]